MDRNIWHLSHEGADLENPCNEPKPDLNLICNNLEDAPDKAEYVKITFDKGIPVAVDGEELDCIELLTKLNEIGANTVLV